jgi:glycosyltransferase involved in cell wall biosynthesis
MKIDISVVIPTHNRTRLLESCLQALFCQTLHRYRFEVIVVTDGPDAATAELIDSKFRELDFSIKLLSLPEKRGPAAARNLGWKNARAALIAFTDDDCLPDPNWLSNLVLANRGEVLAA